eukprot:gnl/TRDRNA2_/TRDRNA2_83592_c0_seq1.p1 gnl/TRDRNA2_/TRDRNA2_83592_c0~~gnl/TRDRNA2_/TRDRNA2_83592_c0_seq1.p1  ORF type:complete len:137 (+),score=12.21 gnl/TRDRNA2_/TRDRNA2_83592_c0_seq1:147-557(+)
MGCMLTTPEQGRKRREQVAKRRAAALSRRERKEQRKIMTAARKVQALEMEAMERAARARAKPRLMYFASPRVRHDIPFSAMRVSGLDHASSCMDVLGRVLCAITALTMASRLARLCTSNSLLESFEKGSQKSLLHV